jgi:NitT/TauT family transport system permease protein
MSAGPDELATLEAGLDALESPAAVPAPASRARRLWEAVWPPALLLAVLVGLWQAAYSLELVAHRDLPSPGQTLGALHRQWTSGGLPDAVLTSVRHAAIGFGVSVVVGTLLGLAVGRVRPLRRALGPLLSVLQSLPSVAWVPASVLWFGATETTVYTVILLGAVPSIANGVVSGLDHVPPLLLRVGQVLGARGLAAARHVLLPAALPGFLVGVRQGWAFAWRSLMAVELLVRTNALGVGNLLSASNKAGDMAGVLAGVAVILLIGLVVEVALFAPLERRVLRRRGLLAATL